MAISKRVLSRMCLYWLPRYLLHLRMKDLSKDPDFADKLGFQIDALNSERFVLIGSQRHQSNINLKTQLRNLILKWRS